MITDLTIIDNFEIHGVAESADGYCSQVDNDSEADFFSVYGHYAPDQPYGGIDALIDCPTRAEAETAEKYLVLLRDAQIAAKELQSALDGRYTSNEEVRDAACDVVRALGIERVES